MANYDKTMTPGRWQQIKDALDAVLELPPAQRESYLGTHFANDPGLQREVRALLEADDAAESFLEEPAQDYARTLVQMNDRPAEDPLIGEVLDSYRVLGVLGRGGMGIVYKARDEDLDRIVAIKMIDPALARDDSFVRRFRSEAQALARIDSRHIVSVYALRQTSRGLFIVMECVDGGTVSDLLEDGPVALETALPIVDQMLQAFEAAHGAGIVHRDIKPGNVMLTTDGVVKVTDFGLAKRFQGEGASMVTMTQGIAGTLHYMSPEQVQGLSDLDHRSDLYSAGMTIYQMLTGRLPIDRDSSEFEVMRSIVESKMLPPSHYNPDLSPEVDRVIMRSLEKDPDDRYPDAHAMREAFWSLNGGSTYQMGRTKTHVPAGRSGRDGEPSDAGAGSDAGRRWAFISGGVVAVLAALALGYVFLIAPGAASTSPDDPPVEQTDTPTVQADDDSQTNEAPEDATDEAATDPSMEARLGTLTISATPSDATIRVNGDRVTSDTPVDVPAGEEVTVEVVRDGYTSWSRTMTMEPGQDRTVTAALERIEQPPPRQTGTIDMAAPAGVAVIVEGQTRQGGGAFTVTAGTQRVTFRHPQYGEWTTTVQVGAGRTVRQQAYFEKRVNIVTMLDGSPVFRGTLNVDGTKYETPSKTLELGRGEHTIRASHFAGGQALEQTKTVTVEPYLAAPGAGLATERVVFQLSRE